MLEFLHAHAVRGNDSDALRVSRAGAEPALSIDWSRRLDRALKRTPREWMVDAVDEVPRSAWLTAMILASLVSPLVFQWARTFAATLSGDTAGGSIAAFALLATVTTLSGLLYFTTFHSLLAVIFDSDRDGQTRGRSFYYGTKGLARRFRDPSLGGILSILLVAAVVTILRDLERPVPHETASSIDRIEVASPRSLLERTVHRLTQDEESLPPVSGELLAAWRDRARDEDPPPAVLGSAQNLRSLAAYFVDNGYAFEASEAVGWSLVLERRRGGPMSSFYPPVSETLPPEEVYDLSVRNGRRYLDMKVVRTIDREQLGGRARMKEFARRCMQGEELNAVSLDDRLNLCGVLYDLLGELDDARECYLRSLEMNPTNAFAHVNVVNFIAARGVAAYGERLRSEPESTSDVPGEKCR